MHIVGEYGSRWSCRSRNSVAIFDDLTSTKSSLKDFCMQFKKENPRLKAIAEHMNNYGTQTLAELGIFSLIWQCLLKPFWTTLSKPRVQLSFVSNLVNQLVATLEANEKPIKTLLSIAELLGEDSDSFNVIADKIKKYAGKLSTKEADELKAKTDGLMKKIAKKLKNDFK